MLTTIIILGTVCIIFLAVIIMQQSALTKKNTSIREIKESMWEFEKESREMDIKMAEARARRRAFAIAGDTLHGITYIIENGVPRYAKLIELLGQITRGAYGVDGRLFHYFKDTEGNPESNYQYPCLNESENTAMKQFLKDIIDGKIEPEAMLELMERLLNHEDNFIKALNVSRYTFAVKQESLSDVRN